MPSASPTVTMRTAAMSEIILTIDGLPILTNESDVDEWERLTSEEVITYWNDYFGERIIVTSVTTDLKDQILVNSSHSSGRGDDNSIAPRTGFVYNQVIGYGILSGRIPDEKPIFFAPFLTDSTRYADSLEVLKAYDPNFIISVVSIQESMVLTAAPSMPPSVGPAVADTGGAGLSPGIVVLIVLAVIVVLVAIAAGIFQFERRPRGEAKYRSDVDQNYFAEDDYQSDTEVGGPSIRQTIVFPSRVEGAQRENVPVVFNSVAATSFLQSNSDSTNSRVESANSRPRASSLVSEESTRQNQIIPVTIDDSIADEFDTRIPVEVDDNRHFRMQVSNMTEPDPQPRHARSSTGSSLGYSSGRSDSSVHNSRTSSMLAGTPEHPVVDEVHMGLIDHDVEEDDTPHLMDHTQGSDEPSFIPSLSGFSMQIVDIDDLDGDI
jgi:hypothetical protein